MQASKTAPFQPSRDFSNAYVALAERADSWTNDVMFPVVAGLVQLLPPIGLTNDVMTLKGEDMFGNEATSVDKGIAVIDLATFGYGKCLKFSKFSSKPVKRFGFNVAKYENKNGMVNNLATGYSVIMTYENCGTYAK